jgi:glycosyltransferase involved in cell wall biosynthesis
MSMSKVSAVIITFNEEADIARALRSIQWCDEVLVVDSGSSDRTPEICAADGCRVLRNEFSGYGAQKAFAVRQAVNDWVFVLDADEEVSPELRGEILTKLEDAGDCRGFYVPITTVLWDHVVRDRTRHTKPKLRLFDRRFGNFQNQLVHESVLLEGRTEQLHHRMYNYAYVNIADYFEKFNRYTSAAARECYLHGKRPSFVAAVGRLPLTFCRFYFLKGFFQDGAIGLVWSLFSALYATVKFLKVLELCRACATADPQLLKMRPIAAAREKKTELSTQNWATAYAADPGTPLTPVRLSGAQEIRGTAQSRGFAYGLTITTVALLLMVLFGRDDPAKYSMVLVAAVGATVWFGGLWPGVAATALALAGFDYFAIPPQWSFCVPNSDGLMQLVVFAAMSTLVGFLIHKAKEQSFR